MRFRVIGHGIAVPENIETSADLAPRVGWTIEKIESHSGVKQRHVAKPDEDISVLAAKAARLAIGSSQPPDLIINASASFRQALPDSSVFIARELGYEGIPSFSINASCISFLVGLQCAASLIASNVYRRILIVSAEFCTRARNYLEAESSVLLGDGAAAIFIENDFEGTEVLHYEMTTWPSGAELTEIRGCGLNRLPQDSRTTNADNHFHMDGPSVLKRTSLRANRYLRRLEDEVIKLEKIDHVIPHQMSGVGLTLMKRVGFREGVVVDIIEEYGNCAAASIPMALATALNQKRIKKGDHVLLFGTAAGLSIGGMLLRW